MRCPKCGAKNPKKKRLCVKCKSPLSKSTAKSRKKPQKTPKPITTLYLVMIVLLGVIIITAAIIWKVTMDSAPAPPSVYAPPEDTIMPLDDIPPLPAYYDCSLEEKSLRELLPKYVNGVEISRTFNKNDTCLDYPTPLVCRDSRVMDFVGFDVVEGDIYSIIVMRISTVPIGLVIKSPDGKTLTLHDSEHIGDLEVITYGYTKSIDTTFETFANSYVLEGDILIVILNSASGVIEDSEELGGIKIDELMNENIERLKGYLEVVC